MSADEFSALGAYATTPEYYESPSTVSMAETSLLTPASPQSSRSSSVHQDEKKATKKRKSWGQELPTPKTNLPPRKRAKTEDEKEQRRIERVLRNRQAAQSSRERKRLEVEKLEGEKYSIERQNYLLKQRLLEVEHEKSALRQQIARMAVALGLDKHATLGAPSVPQSPSLAAILLPKEKAIKQELEDYSFALPTPRASPHTVDPRSSFSSASSSSSRSPSPVNLELGGNAKSSDLTQHPAVSVRGGLAPIHPTGFISRRSSIGEAPATAASPASMLPTPDAAYYGLCAHHDSPQPAAQFFDARFAAEIEDDANALFFDSMVDLDAAQPDIDGDFITFDQHDQYDQDQFSIFASTTPTIDLPHQSATTSSNLQPSLGASS